MLVLAVHSFEAATAKVPFSMIVLLDHVKRRSIPEDLRCRMVIPSSGQASFSLWDVPSEGALLDWLVENLGEDVTSEVYAVEEDFTHGIAFELAKMRAADRIGDSTKRTVDTLGEQTSRAADFMAAAAGRTVETTQAGLRSFDERTGLITAARGTTSTALHRLHTAVEKTIESERLQHVTLGLTSGLKRLGLGGWLSPKAEHQQAPGGLSEDPGVPQPTSNINTLPAAPELPTVPDVDESNLDEELATLDLDLPEVPSPTHMPVQPSQRYA